MKTNRFTTLAALVAVTLLCSACGAVATSSSTGGGTDGGTMGDGAADGAALNPGSISAPEKHRAAPVACPPDRAAGNTVSAGGTCTKDADCTAGRNGRCFGGLQPNACSYDECTADADCGGQGVCSCRSGGRLGQPNVCFKGNCRIDADCQGSFCSPSATSLSLDCQGVKPGSFGFFCHTASDECKNDSDCPTPADLCVLDVDAQHWKCARPLCPD